jgi:rhamnose transport system permease protein
MNSSGPRDYSEADSVPSQFGNAILRRVKSWQRFGMKELILLFVLVTEIVIMSLLSEKFFTSYNLFNMTRNFVEIGIVALGMTLIIISAGIDLSVGSMIGMNAMILGLLSTKFGVNIWLACTIVLLIGLFAGLFNGLIISKVRIPPLVVTLATMYVYRGLAYSVSSEKTFSGFPENFYFLGQGYLLGTQVPVQLGIFVILAVLFYVLLHYTGYGRKILFLGNNELCAKFSGVNVDREKLILYTISGMLCALSAIIMASRVASARADLATGLELDVITAVLVGGTSITGGSGSILATVIGLFIIVVLTNGLALAGFSTVTQTIAVGMVLIIAVYINTRSTRAR